VNIGLHDHLQIRSVFRLKDGTDTLNTRYHDPLSLIKMGVEYALHQTGPLSMAPSQLGAFLRSTPDIQTPDLEFHVQPLSLPKFGEQLDKFPAITTSICNLRPTSRGSVTIDANKQAVINPQYLSTSNDRDIAATSIELTRACVSNHAFQKKYQPVEVLPGAEIQSREELADAAGRIGSSIFHPVGTTKMGAVTGVLLTSWTLTWMQGLPVRR